MSEDDVHLAAALHEITAAYEGPSVTYPRLYAAAITGRIPVTRHGGRLMVCRSDYPRIAEAFGLRPRQRPRAA